jgi:hypothetical protein
MYTHYSIAVMDRGGLARGMYTRSCAYETPELARELGPQDIHSRGERLALVRVETRDEDGTRTVIRETILAVVREAS